MRPYDLQNNVKRMELPTIQNQACRRTGADASGQHSTLCSARSHILLEPRQNTVINLTSIGCYAYTSSVSSGAKSDVRTKNMWCSTVHMNVESPPTFLTLPETSMEIPRSSNNGLMCGGK